METPPQPVSEIEVELLGVARHLAGCPVLTVPVEQSIPLAVLAQRLGERVPRLVGTVVDGKGGFLGGYVLSRDGLVLLRDPEEPIAPGDRLLLLSLSAGG